jgi:hypothetical protein
MEDVKKNNQWKAIYLAILENFKYNNPLLCHSGIRFYVSRGFDLCTYRKQVTSEPRDTYLLGQDYNWIWNLPDSHCSASFSSSSYIRIFLHLMFLPIRSKSLWSWYISTNIMFPDSIHGCLYLKTSSCLFFKTAFRRLRSVSVSRWNLPSWAQSIEVDTCMNTKIRWGIQAKHSTNHLREL